MNNTRWCTKEDILNDLNGLVGMGATDFIDECIVQGQKPPPPHREFFDEDEEIRLRYGSTEPFGDQIEPDLIGITQMLRLVDDFDTEETNNDNSKNKKINLPSDKVVIHKMNPNVQEFVPRNHQNRQNGKENNDSLNDATTNLLLNNKDSKSSQKVDPVDKPEKDSNETSVNKNGAQNGLPEELLKPEKVEDKKVTAAALLKSKITASSKINTQMEKFKRNVAFTALLKLYSEPSPSSSPSAVTPSSSTSPKPVLLCTPDYFEGPSNTATIDKSDNAILEIAENKDYIEEACSQKNTEVDPSIQQSINKVNKWLDYPEEPKITKLTVPHTGPVVFKKKSASSPLPSQSSEETTPAEPSLPSEYVPSDYANELLKKYEERTEKINESKTKAPVDIWTKLESDLKARDEKIKKKDGVLEVSRISARQRINNLN